MTSNKAVACKGARVVEIIDAPSPTPTFELQQWVAIRSVMTDEST